MMYVVGQIGLTAAGRAASVTRAKEAATTFLIKAKLVPLTA